jgi:hypothetical protein
MKLDQTRIAKFDLHEMDLDTDDDVLRSLAEGKPMD